MFSAHSHNPQRWNIWNTRISKALTYALVLPLLSVIAAVSGSQQAHATATVGTGICAQTVGSATGVTVTQVGNDCLVQFTDTTASNTWTVPANIVNNTARILVVGGGGGGGDYTGDPGGRGH